MSDPLKTTENLKPGDVCVVAVKMRDKRSGEDYWWKRFVVVIAVAGAHDLLTLTLKLRPEERDERWVELRDKDNIVTFLPEEQHPQGVVAMRMKLIMQGIVKLGED